MNKHVPAPQLVIDGVNVSRYSIDPEKNSYTIRGQNDQFQDTEARVSAHKVLKLYLQETKSNTCPDVLKRMYETGKNKGLFTGKEVLFEGCVFSEQITELPRHFLATSFQRTILGSRPIIELTGEDISGIKKQSPQTIVVPVDKMDAMNFGVSTNQTLRAAFATTRNGRSYPQSAWDLNDHTKLVLVHPDPQPKR